MMAAAQGTPATTGHIPVLLDSVISAIAPVHGTWIDGTFGGGGYSRALLRAGAETVIGLDRDPTAIRAARDGLDEAGGAIVLVEACFGDLDRVAHEKGHSSVDGVVLDIGVSSMQIDTARRGFSFQKDGPLDMRMGEDGISAADLVATLSEKELADLLFQLGEERAARRIAARIVAARAQAPIVRTLQLAEIIAGCLPRPKPGQPHAATRSFQALRIAVNDELGELVRGLMAAENILHEGGILAVVTFHSLEDRIVKRFIQLRSGAAPRGSRHAPETEAIQPAFERVTRKAIGPDTVETDANPRARSAKLRVARRLASPAGSVDPHSLGLPAYPSIVNGDR